MEDEFSGNYPDRWLSLIFTQPWAIYEDPAREAGRLDYLLRCGAADIIHLRKPEADADYCTALLEAMSPETRARVMLHDHFHLLKQYNLRGVHLNRRNPSAPPGARRLSASFHDTSELPGKSELDYFTLSPIFPSISKQGYMPRFSPEELRPLLPPGKTIALGGVTPDSLFRLRRNGFAGSAMLGWIWGGDFRNRARALALRLKLLRSFPLLLITDSPTAEGTVRQAALAYEGGCRWVQVRMKGAERRDIIRAVTHLKRHYPDMLLSVDDDCTAALLGGADGVHLGKNDIATAGGREILGYAPIIGRTANTPEDIRQIAASPEGNTVDYFGIGPLRYTTTKKNLAPVLGFEGYRRILAGMRADGIHTPVLAIGGITPADVPELLATGVDGVAVSGAINSAPDPVAATRRFLAALRLDSI